MSKITLQVIADSLGMSRNTVSKVINNYPVPKETKDRVLKKAAEFGYKGFTNYEETREVKHLNILLLTGRAIANLDFFLSIIRGIEESIQKYDIDFFQFTMQKDKVTLINLKITFNP